MEDGDYKTPESIRVDRQYVGQDLNNVLIHAEDEAKPMGDEYVSVEHLFLAMLKYPSPAMKALFQEYGHHKGTVSCRHYLPCAAIRGLPPITRKQHMIHWKNMVMIW